MQQTHGHTHMAHAQNHTSVVIIKVGIESGHGPHRYMRQGLSKVRLPMKLPRKLAFSTINCFDSGRVKARRVPASL